ncbi:PRC-barrel domain-containing protein [Granulosicoccus antarcticus]|uniref:PRC-barrel domain-containing protein n=1 Tax=Granulosicoccus antarcticus IMCC3135 TaxID=1192854 RepID=A0A2Z2NQJ8_9GAMM|nr:PRC-barrel domain-containing protein [Granulosicoccus antarcticus]ASJ72261.1 hypothetical protein IMCC3135_10845 [Granulosicoccus antarcticus IMCC3135]
MLISAKEMEGYSVGANDGDIGHVKDFYLDDEQWVIRYLVVDTGGWLSGRRVLVSPIAAGTPNREQRLLPVSLTRDQLSKSPDIDTEKPVSRQHEITFSAYYAYPYYWSGDGYWGGGMDPGLMMPSYAGFHRSPTEIAKKQHEIEQAESDQHEHDDPHLRSCNALIGYHIHASDGDIGHVAGMLIDEQTWAVRYLIVDTSNWWLGHQVLIAPQWFGAVNWFDKTTAVSMTRQAIKDAPAYKSQAKMSREAEDRLLNYYGHAKYWAG